MSFFLLCILQSILIQIEIHNGLNKYYIELIPKDLEKELCNIYVCACELLRHFWRSFPPTTPQLEEKAIRMHESLHRFHSAKLKPFEVSAEYYSFLAYRFL